jgi:xanthine dehydrogenase YagS FAD-binding subunit
MSGKTVLSARIVLGHVAPVPWVSPEAARVLEGKTITRQLAEQAGRAALGDARPLSHNAYKVQLARVAVQRAILAAAGMTPAGSAS